MNAVVRTGGWVAARRRIDRLAADDTAVSMAIVALLALYYLIPSPLLALPLLLAYAALVWLRLDLALALLPLAFPFWYVPKRVIGHAVFPLSEIALVVCLGVALVREAPGLVRPQGRRRLLVRLRGHVARLGLPLGVGVALFVLGGTLGILVARRPHEALRAYRWEIAEPLVYLALVMLYVRGPLALRRLVWAFLGSALVLVALATLQITVAHVTFAPLASGNRLVPLPRQPDGSYRVTAFIYGNGNSLGTYVGRALPLALALALGLAHGVLSRRAGGLRAPRTAVPSSAPRISTPPVASHRLSSLPSRILRAVQVSRSAAASSPASVRLARGAVLAAGIALACAPVILWSGSRGSELAAAVAAAVVVCVAARRPWLLAALAALTGLMAWWQRTQLLNAALTGHGGSGVIRWLVWLAAWHMIRDHPLLGIGPDQFIYYYSSRYTSHPYWITVLNGRPTLAVAAPDLAHPHNLALDLWLSAGLLGLVGFTLALSVLVWRLLRLWRAHVASGRVGQSAWLGAVALGLGGALLASLVYGLADSAYFVPDLALIFWWSMAALLVAERCGRGSAPAPPLRTSSQSAR